MMSIDMITDKVTQEALPEAREPGEFLLAALSYMVVSTPAGMADGTGEDLRNVAEFSWPWPEGEFQPSDDPIHNLVQAAAFIAAEIERRLDSQGWPQEDATNGEESEAEGRKK